MTGAAGLPPHAYLPGRTPRHPDGTFDDLRATARPAMAPADLARSAAFRSGLAWIDAGFFWEAHEVLEPVWLACPPQSPERHLTQGLIQFANAALKARMGKPAAARRLCGLAQGHVAQAGQGGRGQVMGVDLRGLAARIDSFLAPEQTAI